MDEFEKQLQNKFAALKAQDASSAPAFPDLEALTPARRRPSAMRYAPWGGALAACIAVAFAMTLQKPEPINPDTWVVAELPQWASSTDTLLSVSDRALPAANAFEPLNIKATFGRSLSLGRGQ